ncbi:MAG: hypothetical protein ACRC9L_09150 [Brevinema sp.]
MILLRFDRRHIRMFYGKSGDICPCGFADNLLPFAENIFATSSSIVVSRIQLYQLNQLAKIFSKPPKLLNIVNNFPFECQYQGKKFSLSEEKTKFWQQSFEENRLIHTAIVRFSKNYSRQGLWNHFCEDLGIQIDDDSLAISGLDVFLPVEITKNPCFFVQKSKKPIISRPFQSLSMFFDKNMPLAQREARRISALAIKRKWVLESSRPDILFISGYGALGRLQNEALEEKMNLYPALLTVINACSLQNTALPQGAVIYSPYDTEVDRSIFAPLMRFLHNPSPKSLLYAFFIASIFYPNIANYYRLKLPVSREFFY